ncbi:transcriptional regulator [Halobacteria archaeon AArc-m2/3/4]|uniref:Transcriptional regulator n=1 Tax=Natronoglomus mannanivorans TaxID=2979990 RepID=A0ABT2Q978_9EURY|nr:transcriptional regulator [Halobacteria archaeon AArc-m2/3/4]
MDPRTTERVERWDSRPFSNGYDGLSDLAKREFSGAVTTAGTWLFMLNGRVVGIVDGTIEDFDGATGTTYEAPDPALPLLCSMEETGGETRGKYYTNETPLEEVDGTLSSGSFTGYVELSEGVLSGDYYAVYYGGRRMAAAYIGNAERLLTGEEAFERAADEVGIYEVVDVDVDVTDVPGSEGASATGTKPESADDETGSGTTPPAPTDSDSDAANGQGSTTPSTSTPTSPSSGSAEPTTDTGAETAPATEIESAHGDVGGDSRTESRSASEPSEPEPSEPEPVSGPDSDPKPDSTLENVTGGITTSDERSVESTPTGITDDLSAPLADAERDESESEPASEPESDPEPEPTTETDVISEAEAKPESAHEDESSAPSTADDGTESTTDAVDPGADRSPSSAPDPDDLEAAAEELSESGVPWSSGSSDSSEASDSSTPTADELDVTFDATADTDESAAELEERFKQEEQWRETRSIPSIDPDKTAGSATPPSKRGATNRRNRGRSRSAASQSRPEDSSNRRSGSSSESRADASSTFESARETGTKSNSEDESRSSSPANAEPTDHGTQKASSRQNSARDSGQQSRNDGATQRDATSTRSESPDDALESDMLEREDKIDRLTQQLDDLEQRRDELETKAADLEHERDRLQSENEELTETVERLESRIDDLESELERVRSADATGAMADSTATDSRGTKLSPQQALAGTNLFVRYGSKSQPTLQAAHDDDADATSVNSNLLLEHHTQFDDADVSVGGEPYEEFLTSTMEYQFVDWLTGTLLYEIRDTGHGTSLGDLYDVIPRIDRAELHASISLEDDDTDEVPDQVTFDVVAFDKRGTPLVAANLNDSRDPATREMLIDLEETASAVNANFPDLGAAMVVTSSYFEPGALEVAEQATSGGFLSRGSKLSYVNLSRKQGYHMCLVESRSGGFHMNVPEL